VPDPRRPSRRAALLSLSGLSALPWLSALAQGTPALNSLPRVALVVGNSRYGHLPPLRNPGNDAVALGGRLRAVGFEVALEMDTAKAALEAAIERFCAKLGNCVGLFYFAGHGVQVAWRNYLVPVDANLENVDDVPKRSVDLVTLIEALRRSRNPMNIIILDACRDNPFAVEGKAAKGLSQMDAPVGTLLAYATAPGNTASDGEGGNGLYTEHLLNEMGRKDAKIEDVFKRVRLNVRRASNGRQVPWESTSLEDDFYFFPESESSTFKRLARDRRFAEDLRAWQEADAKVAAAFRALTAASSDERAR
jgi:uncharacterized caspase-like protein